MLTLMSDLERVWSDAEIKTLLATAGAAFKPGAEPPPPGTYTAGALRIKRHLCLTVDSFPFLWGTVPHRLFFPHTLLLCLPHF